MDHEDDAPTPDVVLVYGKAAAGDGWSVLRQRGDALEAGELKPMVQGQPLLGELVRLTRRPEHELLFEVEVVLEKPDRARGGPPQVATRAYRAGWDAAFGGKRELN